MKSALVKTLMVSFFSLIALGLIAYLFSFLNVSKTVNNPTEKKTGVTKVVSIDTMKYSRDLAREKLNDLSFDVTINKQVKEIADTGATHVAIGTPYDDEFTPFLKRWVKVGRKYNLHIWFRGNLSGWEKWFGYPPIDRGTHTKNIEKFILDNSDLFENGDIFGSCNECENGGPGDPRQTGDVTGFRDFLVNEYKATKNAFAKINKSVGSNYNSMNYDVANLVMDTQTTKDLGGLVVIDHYIANPDEYTIDIQSLAHKSGGEIILGEFGAPIPDIHGNMTDQEQAQWIFNVLGKVMPLKEVAGVNYWVSEGGSTELWANGNAKKAVGIIQHFYRLNKDKEY